MKLLIINPGSTSTKVSVFADEKEEWRENVFHDAPQLLDYPDVNSQLPFRREVLSGALKKHGMSFADIDVFVGRGGSAYPQPAGVTRVDELLYRDTEKGVGGSEHPAKLGVMLAYTLGLEYGKPAYTLDPTNVDELCDEARLTGIQGVYRNAQSHVLNQRAVALSYARSVGKAYEELKLVVAHIDGGITVNAHDHGRMVDGNVGAGGDGPMTPTRLGSVPVLPLLDYIDAHGTAQVRRMCSRAGGFVSFFGTADADRVRALAQEGDEKARLVWRAMIYQVAKSIGEMSTVLKGQVDAILLTGGLVRFPEIVEGLTERCGWIAPIHVITGEREQEALAHAVLRALRGETPIRTYPGRPVWEGFPWDRQ